MNISHIKWIKVVPGVIKKDLSSPLISDRVEISYRITNNSYNSIAFGWNPYATVFFSTIGIKKLLHQIELGMTKEIKRKKFTVTIRGQLMESDFTVAPGNIFINALVTYKQIQKEEMTIRFFERGHTEKLYISFDYTNFKNILESIEV